MTMFIKLENGLPIGYPIVEDNLRYLFPNKFPNSYIFTPLDVEPLGYGIYEFTQIPTIEYPMKAVETVSVKGNDGIYYQSWDIVEMNEEEKAQATIVKALKVRSQRNFNLSQSDWTQLSDAPLTEAEKLGWDTYRQELRDMPNHPEFPWATPWPNHPPG